jgi:hypothetical protein
MDGSDASVIRKDFAGLLIKGVNLMGGTLVLTEEELLFVPLIGRDSLSLSSRAASLSKRMHDWSIHPQTLLNAAVKPLARQIRIPLRNIESVDATRRCALRFSWLDEPQHRLTEYGISSSRFAPVWSPDNVVSRNALLAAINDALQSLT